MYFKKPQFSGFSNLVEPEILIFPFQAIYNLSRGSIGRPKFLEFFEPLFFVFYLINET